VCDRLVQVSQGGLSVAFPKSAGPLDLSVDLYDMSGATDGGVVGAPTLLAHGGAQQYDPSVNLPLTVALALSNQFGCAPQPLKVARAFHTATLLPNGQILIAGGLVASASGTPQLDSVTMPTLLATSSIEVYDAHSGEPIGITDLGGGGTGTPTARAFGAAYYLGQMGGKFGILLVDGVAPSDASMPVVSAADSTNSTGQPVRLWPTANATPAQADLLEYDPLARTVSHTILPFCQSAPGWQCAELGGASQIDPTLPNPVDAAPVLVGVSSPNLTDSSFTSPTVRGVLAQAAPSTWGPFPSLAPHVGASIIGIDYSSANGGSAIVLGGDMRAAPAVAEFITGVGGVGSIGRCTLTSATGVDLTAYQTVTPLASPASSFDVLRVGGFTVVPGTTSSTAISPDTTVAQRLTVSGATGPSCPSAAPALVATTVASATGFSPLPVGYHDAVRLPSGDVLIAGGALDSTMCPSGVTSQLCSTTQAMIYSAKNGDLEPLPATSPVGSDAGAVGPGGLVVGRMGHRLTALSDGTVVVTGGITLRSPNDLEVVNSVELYGGTVNASRTFTLGLESGTEQVTQAPGDLARDSSGTAVAICPFAN
jgi:hypothetical protein